MALFSPGGPLAHAYHAAPPGLQGAIASAYGFKVGRLRYGGSFATRLAGYRERDLWSRDQLLEWQRVKLMALLRHAASHVPYYVRLREQGRFPIEEVRSVEDLSRLPLLDKDAVRADPEAFLASNRRPLHVLYTSGTTGTPLRLYRSTETIRDWYACFEQRARAWSGVSRTDRYAMLGGQLVVPVRRDRPPFWVYNAALRQLYMSAYHLGPRFMDAYLDELGRRRIVHLYGYASAMDALATHALQSGRRDVKLRVAVSNAEPLFDHQRDRIAEAFSCQVRDTYGNTELSVAAFECAGRRMHLSMEVAAIEVVDAAGVPCPAGATGEFACTGLLNFDHVLIRYRPGDSGALRADESPCNCGRHSPSLAAVEGRTDDVLVTVDGRRVGRLDPVFKGGMHLREAQIVQMARDEIHVNVVPAAGYSQADADAIVARLRERVGAMNVRIIEVAEIPRSSNGKFRAVLNLLGKSTTT